MCAARARKSLPKKALSSPAACGIVAGQAMSEFKFACPVCGQHITVDSGSSGQQIDCPTCYRKIVVPQAPASHATKLILSAAQVGKTRPSSADAYSQLGPLHAPSRHLPLWVFVMLVLLLGVAGAALYVYRDRIVQALRKPASAATNAGPQETATNPLNTTYPVPTNITWSLDLTNADFPEAIATGCIHGSGFYCERASLRGGLLSLSQGKAWPWDLSVALNLYARRGEELSGWTINIDSARTKAPKVVLHWKDSSQQPTTETITSGYALRLVFGQATNGRIPGKIYICLPDATRSVVAGTFDAQIRKPEVQQSAPPTPPTPPKPKR
jgi:hypothetical protein